MTGTGRYVLRYVTCDREVCTEVCDRDRELCTEVVTLENR